MCTHTQLSKQIKREKFLAKRALQDMEVKPGSPKEEVS
jgi:hypothetical protein